MIKLSLRNFRGVVESSIDLPDVAILIGGNNSGKTTVLEAIFLAPDPLRKTPYKGGVPAIMAVGHIHESLKASGYEFLLHKYSADSAEVSLTIDDVKNRLFIVKDERLIGYYTSSEEGGYFFGWTERFSSNYTITPPSVDHEYAKFFRELYYLSKKVYDVFFKSRLTYKYPTLVKTLLYHPSLMSWAWEGFLSRWVEIQPLTSKVANQIAPFIWEPIVNFTLEPFGGDSTSVTLYALLEDGSRIRIGDLGDGAKNLITLMLLYEYSKPQVLLIDDLESHMNPRAISVMLDWLSEEVEKGLRLVASTHSLDVAKRFLARLEGSKAVLLGLKNGKLSYKLLTLDDLEELESAGLDTRVAEYYLL